MNITEITADYSVSSQITSEDVAEIKQMGFKSIMCNRPDSEADNQPKMSEICTEAVSQGLGFAFVPVVSGMISPENVEQFGAALDELPAPVLAYCRSGARCQQLWTLSR